MVRRLRRRDLLGGGALAGAAAVLLPRRADGYGPSNSSRAMRAPPLEDGEAIWQWLLLLIDASSSTHHELKHMTFYDLQIEATARALTQPCVVARLTGDPHSRTAVGAILWSANGQQEVAVDWSVIRAPEDVAAIGARLRQTLNHLGSQTGVAAAVRFAVRELRAEYISATSRRVIDVMANGRDNQGGVPATASHEAEALGITVNAVVMEGYDGTVDQMAAYYRSNVITGDGLVFKVENEGTALEALATACASKLCAEIALAPADRRETALDCVVTAPTPGPRA